MLCISEMEIYLKIMMNICICMNMFSCLFNYNYFNYFHVYISTYFIKISVYVTYCQIPIFDFICRSTVDHFSWALHAIKLHPISPTKIFMPVCIFRFYQYVESLTWGTLKQVIRVYCTIKSMTFLKIFSFGDKIFISVTLIMVHRLSKTLNVFIFLYSFYLSMNISGILIFC